MERPPNFVLQKCVIRERVSENAERASVFYVVRFDVKGVIVESKYQGLPLREWLDLTVICDRLEDINKSLCMIFLSLVKNMVGLGFI